MSWVFAPEWLDSSLGCDSQNLQLDLFASSRPTRSPREFFGSATECPSGMTSAPSLPSPGPALSSASQPASLASPGPSPATNSGPTIRGGSGRPCSEPFARFDPDTCSWRMSQACSKVARKSCSETWPAWGILSRGECFLASPWAPPTSESAGSLWPTLTARDYRSGTLKPNGHPRAIPLAEAAYRFSLQAHADGICPPPSGLLNPGWGEWLMGFPSGWIVPGGTPQTERWEILCHHLLQRLLGESCPADSGQTRSHHAA